MKIIIMVLSIFYSINIDGQAKKLDVKLCNGWNTILLISDSIKVDTLSQHGYDFEFIDFKIEENQISYIIETPYTYDYFKLIKHNGKWEMSKTSGQLSGRPERIASMPTPELLESIGKKKEFKIIGDDKVYMKIGDKETIKDCNDFKIEFEAREREYQEWLIKEEAKKQEKKKTKELKIDKKEFEKIK